MKCLAQTQGQKVRVNAVLPGLLLTEWVRPLRLLLLRNNVSSHRHRVSASRLKR